MISEFINTQGEKILSNVLKMTCPPTPPLSPLPPAFPFSWCEMNIKGPELFVGLQHIRPSPWDGLRSCVTIPRPLINGQASTRPALLSSQNPLWHGMRKTKRRGEAEGKEEEEEEEGIGGERRGCEREIEQTLRKSHPMRSLQPFLIELGTGRVHNNMPHCPAKPLSLSLPLPLALALSQRHMTGFPFVNYITTNKQRASLGLSGVPAVLRFKGCLWQSVIGL